MASLKRLIVVASLLALAPCARAQDEDEGARAGLSRGMRIAIEFYEQGEDMRAMDGFMEILTKGDPQERSMANEYINLITHRMNTSGGGGGAPAAPRPGPTIAEPVARDAVGAPSAQLQAARRPSGGEVVAESASASTRRMPPPAIDDPEPAPRSRAPRRGSEEMSSSNKALMRKEIRARLRAAQDRSLNELKAVDGIRIVMRENGDPEAVGIPSTLLFQTGIAFQRDAARILDPLTKLVFALGSTQALILPEGTSLGDAKVLDMRRTMGISSHLFQAGVAPPRVKVNLLNSQVDIPKGLLDFKGVVIVFVYNQPMNLAVESAVGDELGPPISLGIYPAQIRPARNQGAIIEFSVSDPPAGLVSWKFQLLQPNRDGTELTPLQEVVGGGPVFHQIFWNGKQNYFGQPLPPGRYECVLSALDAKNRQRTLHRWIQVLDDSSSGEKLLAADAPPEPAKAPPAAATEPAAPAPVSATAIEPVPAGGAPSADLGGSAKPLVEGVKAAVSVAHKASAPKKPAPKRVVKRPTRAKKAEAADKGREKKAVEPQADPDGEPAAAKPAEESAPSTPGRYKLVFNKDTHQMTAPSERTLAKAVKELAGFPLEALRVIGQAGPDEAEGATLAERRAKMVAGLLINRYQVEPKRLQVSSAAGEGPAVELVMARND